MKPTINRKNLLTKDDIWNAVILVVSEADLPTPDLVLREASTVFQYYSELESGGHEMLLNWASSYIEEISFERYLHELLAVLEKVGAHDYAVIERTYGQDMWNLYVALEIDESKEDEFLEFVEKADDAYDRLDGKLEQLVEAYFVKIHIDLIDVVGN